MVLSIALILLIAALIAILVHAITGKCPLWVGCLLIVIVLLLGHLPLK